MYLFAIRAAESIAVRSSVSAGVRADLEKHHKKKQVRKGFTISLRSCSLNNKRGKSKRE
jgi:hypothetical protein